MSITVLGNVGNQGYALPMVSAFPTNVNSQYLLAWSPTDQALAYVPYTGSPAGDWGVVGDLTVGDDATIVGDLAAGGNGSIGGTFLVSGVATFSQKPIFSLGATSNGSIDATVFNVASGGNTGTLNPTSLLLQSTQVLTTRRTGWTAATGTATRTTFATGAVTLPQLAERVKALLDDLIAHGLIGA